jgi:hypothetical protein
MNKFVIGALAITSAGSLAYAGGAETKEWSKLDRDILSLNSASVPGAEVQFSGFVRVRGAHSNDVDVDNDPLNGEQELRGFGMDNVRVMVDLSQGDFGAHIALDAVQFNESTLVNDLGNVFVLDAFATAKIAEGWMGQIGRFRAPFLGSALIEENNMLLLDRTFNGQVWDFREEGVQVGAVYDRVGFALAVQNGSDGLVNGYRWTGRVTFTPMGAIGNQEGAFGAPSETSFRLAAAYSDDTDDSTGHEQDGEAWAVEGNLTQGPFSLHIEMVDYEDDVTPHSDPNLSTGVINAVTHVPAVGTFHGSETPWSATLGFLVQPNVELVGRYEDLDDSDDTTATTLGVNVYGAGHNAKFTVQASRLESDDTDKEIDTLAIGVTVGA